MRSISPPSAAHPPAAAPQDMPPHAAPAGVPRAPIGWRAPPQGPLGARTLEEVTAQHAASDNGNAGQLHAALLQQDGRARALHLGLSLPSGQKEAIHQWVREHVGPLAPGTYEIIGAIQPGNCHAHTFLDGNREQLLHVDTLGEVLERHASLRSEKGDAAPAVAVYPRGEAVAHTATQDAQGRWVHAFPDGPLLRCGLDTLHEACGYDEMHRLDSEAVRTNLASRWNTQQESEQRDLRYRERLNPVLDSLKVENPTLFDEIDSDYYSTDPATQQAVLEKIASWKRSLLPRNEE